MLNSKQFLHVVGIDISKKSFDAAILDDNFKKIGHCKFVNNLEGFEDLLSWIFTKIESPQDTLYIMEHTGVYSRGLRLFLHSSKYNVCMESGFNIASRSGVRKGKSDKKDAYLIAEYALNRRGKLVIEEYCDESILTLHDLLSNRRRLIDTLKILQTPLKELEKYAHKQSVDLCLPANEKAIKGIKQSIKDIETSINEFIENQQGWQQNFKMACSVDGIGKWLAAWMIVYTRNFDPQISSRKFASMVGIAPFENESGTSIKKGNHISKQGNSYLKGLMHVMAMAAIRSNSNIKAYFERKKNQEKKKGFIAMNNIKNKLVQTVFAVVRNGVEFTVDYKHPKAA